MVVLCVPCARPDWCPRFWRELNFHEYEPLLVVGIAGFVAVVLKLKSFAEMPSGVVKLETVTGDLSINGGKFIVRAADGNMAFAGALTVSYCRGARFLSSASILLYAASARGPADLQTLLSLVASHGPSPATYSPAACRKRGSRSRASLHAVTT